MKVAAFFEDSVTSGGGYNQALNALKQLKAICDEGGHELAIYTTKPESRPLLEKTGAAVHSIKPNLADKLLVFSRGNPFVARFISRFTPHGGIEARLKRDKCDLVYFLTPSARPFVLQELNFVYTLWDNCHRDFPEFPEVRRNSEFDRREAEIRGLLPKAICVVVDSEELKGRLARRYGLDEERILSMPFSPSPFLDERGAEENLPAALGRLGLEPGYFFYPAQFWPHKNHVRLIEALGILKRKGVELRLVLSGGDKGNAAHIRALAGKVGVEEQIHFVGFVAPADINSLYRGAAAVVMPTYFGPTNLPPLEAWAVGRPLIYPAHLAGQTQDAAQLFDVDDPQSLSEAIEGVLAPGNSARLVEKGHARLTEIDFERQRAETDLAARLNIFARRRANWPT